MSTKNILTNIQEAYQYC